MQLSPRRSPSYWAEGADPNTVDDQGRTTLHLLVGRGSGDDAVGRIAVPELLDAGANVNARDDRGRTPLHDAVDAAVRWGTPAEDATHVIQLLLRAGADANARTHLGESPLHMAAPASWRPGTWVGPRDAKVVKPVISALLEAGAEISARANDGRTPLHAVVQGNQPAAVLALLEAGADPALRDDAGNLADPTTWRALGQGGVLRDCRRRCHRPLP